MFKRRVAGYFAIITQAVAAILTILIVGQQGYTGGIMVSPTCARCTAGISAPTTPIILYFVEWCCCSVHRRRTSHR